MSSVRNRTLAVVFAAAALAVAPAAGAQDTYGANRIDGKTEVEKAMGRCAATVLVGALLGAAVGSDSGQAGRGAAIGAAAGAGVCAIMLKVASNKDKERLREAQLAAANSGASQTTEWTTDQGQDARATVTASPIVQVSAPKTQETLPCRRTRTEVTVGEQSNQTTDVVCLHGDRWLTLDKLKALGIKPADVHV